MTKSPIEAAEFIKNGGIVSFPTETVYGLGANVFDADAVAMIFEAKRRPADNPLIAHVANLSQIHELTTDITDSAEKFVACFFPGPLTIVLKKAPAVPMIATAGLDTIGVRMPGHELARQFLEACGVPVVAPSANLSGKPSPTTWQTVLEDLDGRIDCILMGEATEIGLESTVVDCTSDMPVLLRQGAISLEELQTVVPDTVSYKAVDGEPVRSPGLKHKHYSPQAAIVLIEPGSEIPDLRSENAAYIGLYRPSGEYKKALICSSAELYAHSLFEFFRECDREAIGMIYCETVAEDGIGAALMDRLRRAAED